MGRKRTIIVLSALGALAAMALAFILTPPAKWRQIRIGMPRAEVERLVQFDYASPERPRSIAYEAGTHFTWGLGVTWKEGKTARVCKELWVHWPREAPTMIWSCSDEQK